MTTNRLSALLLSATLALIAAHGTNQVAGFAEITEPRAGESLQGLVTVVGTASHPSFAAYEVAFGHDPNPTETWFPITERLGTPVQDARLALWDTEQITPGRYQLRVTVYTQEADSLEAIVGNLHVGKAPTITEQPAQALEAPGAAGEEEARAEPPPDGDTQPPSATLSAEASLARLLLVGAAGGAAALTLFGAYVGLRPRVRDHFARLQMRRQRRERRRRRDGRP